jgi:hypothetical protein
MQESIAAFAHENIQKTYITLAATLLLESTPRESYTGAHEDLPHMPADLLR